MPGIAPTHFIYIVASFSSKQSRGINFYSPCFIDKQTQAWRNSVTCPWLVTREQVQIQVYPMSPLPWHTHDVCLSSERHQARVSLAHLSIASQPFEAVWMQSHSGSARAYQQGTHCLELTFNPVKMRLPPAHTGVSERWTYACWTRWSHRDGGQTSHSLGPEWERHCLCPTQLGKVIILDLSLARLLGRVES